MPLPISMDATWLDGSVQFNGQELRRADAALLTGDGNSPFSVQGGIVRHSDSSLAVTVNASDQITVQPGAVVIPGNSGVGNGAYRTALAAAETGQLAARNATNPRMDRVIYRVLDTSVVGSHGAFTGRIEVLTGTPNATPLNGIAALPALAVELARVTVPASGGGAASVDSTWRTFAAAIGGVLPVATAARLPTAPNAKWLKAVAIDTGAEYEWDGTAWQQGAWKAYTPVISSWGVGAGSVTGRYTVIGKTVHYRILAVLGAGFSAPAAGMTFTLPLPMMSMTPNPNGKAQGLGQAVLTDVGSQNYAALALYGLTTVSVYVQGVSGGAVVPSATAPFTWVNGDFIEVTGTYEAA